ncbi:MAG: acylphosphatase [Actinomycetota bacterium]
MEAKRMRVVVSGDVQGVGFRWYCRGEALARAVSGFVRNLPDGRVEAAFEGDPDAVDAMVEWCRRGPEGATVTSMDVEEEEPAGGGEFAITG